MDPILSNPAPPEAAEPKLKIYFLPNLLTAGNLFCGFLALTRIVEAGTTAPERFNYDIRQALFFILLACIFDLFDGRVARILAGRSNPGSRLQQRR